MQGEAKVTLSVLEKAFLKVLKAAGLPLPDTNIRVGKHRVDLPLVRPTYKDVFEDQTYMLGELRKLLRVA